MTLQPPELQYQEPPHPHRKIVRRIALILIACIGIALSIPMLKREMERQRLIRLYEACCHMKLLEVVHTPKRFVVPSEWRELNAGLGTNISSAGTVFLGELRTPGGAGKFLIGVDLTSWSHAPTILNVRTRCLAPGRQPHYQVASDESIMLPDSAQSLVLEGGKIDPENPNHFTIGYQADNHQGVIDGWLQSDGTVTFEPRDTTSAIAPAPPSAGLSQ